MMIMTERLELIPLTARQLKLWLEDVSTLENELNCSYCAEPLEGHFYDVVFSQLVKMENDSDYYLYHSFWFILRKTDRVVVGSCGFKNIPNESGEVEIGYGLGKEFEGEGYMSEAITTVCKWALSQENVHHVIAETENDNPKSENVLKRIGFTIYKQNETNWWRL